MLRKIRILWYRLVKRCVYCKQCGRYRLYKQRDSSCVCGSNWRRIEDDWPWPEEIPYRWSRRTY